MKKWLAGLAILLLLTLLGGVALAVPLRLPEIVPPETVPVTSPQPEITATPEPTINPALIFRFCSRFIFPPLCITIFTFFPLHLCLFPQKKRLKAALFVIFHILFAIYSSAELSIVCSGTYTGASTEVRSIVPPVYPFSFMVSKICSNH